VRKKSKAISTEKLPPLPSRNEIHIVSTDERGQKPSAAANFLNNVLSDDISKTSEKPAK